MYYIVNIERRQHFPAVVSGAVCIPYEYKRKFNDFRLLLSSWVYPHHCPGRLTAKIDRGTIICYIL